IDKTLVAGTFLGATSNILTFYLYPGRQLAVVTPTVVADGHWHQAVATLSPLGTMLYLDGNLAATNANTACSGIAGYWRIFPGEGLVGDVRIYSLALTSSQVQQLYTYEAVTSCPPHPATATATVTDGVVVAATITDGGCGYTNTPVVLIVGGGGSNATATAVVNDGMVVGIAITDLGSGYTNTPQIVISSPLGLELSLIKSVKPSFNNLTLTTNYQLQVSGDLKTWTNQGSPFPATNTSMVYPQYFDVPDWNQLFFRLEPPP
ncbi:MAG: LamG-like jellyroll fold domain-containing protein, partial [Verrucomicrobiota bacterium]